MGAGGHLLWLEVRRSPPPFFVNLSLCLGRPCFSSSDVFLFCWAAFLSISLLASVFPVSLPLFFLFLRPCLIHARLPEGGRAFVHGHTFLHSWSGPMTVVIGLLHGATFLSGLPLVLFVSFIGPWQLERTIIKSLLIILLIIIIILILNIQVGLNMHLYDDIRDALSFLRGSTYSYQFNLTRDLLPHNANRKILLLLRNIFKNLGQ